MNKIFIFILFISIFFVACNKDAALVDNTLNINDLELKSIDSFTLTSKTVLNPAIDGKNIPYALFGQTNDIRIGSSKASFYTEFSLTKNAIEIGDNPVLDSVILILDQVSSYGELLNNVDVDVYELIGSLDNTLDYDNNVVLNVKSNTLASVNDFNFSKGISSIRIPLKASFGNNLLNVFETNVMENSDNFKAFFKGMYVTVSSLNGDGVVSLNLKTDKTKIELFYHTDTEVNQSYSYKVNAKDITINQYVNAISGSEASSASTNTDNEELAYISSMSGFKTLLEFPDLTSLKNVIINKAELSVYQADFGTAESINNIEPNRLFLFQNLQDTSIKFLPDFSLENTEPFGGVKKTVAVNGENTAEYTFYITKYIQSLVNNSASTNKLYLTDITNNEGNRIKIGGGKHPTTPIKLNIVYTELKK